VHDIKCVIKTWLLIIGLAAVITLAILIGYRNLPKSGGLQKVFSADALRSLLAIMNTAHEVGYGAIITMLAVCGLTHKQFYLEVGAITCIKTTRVFVVILFYRLTGIC